MFAAGLAVRRIERATSGDRPAGEVVEIAEAGRREEIATAPETRRAYLAQALLAFNEQLERVGEVVVVLLVGAALVVAGFPSEALWFVPLLFLVLRPIAVVIGLVGAHISRLQLALTSWFGIRGIGSVYYLSFAITHGLPADARTDARVSHTRGDRRLDRRPRRLRDAAHGVVRGAHSRPRRGRAHGGTGRLWHPLNAATIGPAGPEHLQVVPGNGCPSSGALGDFAPQIPGHPPPAWRRSGTLAHATSDVATMLFTDIVKSTAMLEREGDRAWRKYFFAITPTAGGHRLVPRTLVMTTGDGSMVVFHSATNAVRCGAAMGRAADQLGVQIRVASIQVKSN